MHEGTGGAPITRTNFGPITRENSREAIKILGGLVRNRCRPLGHAHHTMGVQDPLCNAAATDTSGTGDHIPQGVLKVVVSEPLSARAAEQGSDRACSTHPGLLQPIVPCSQGNRGVELHYGDASVNPQGPSTWPVVNLPRPERRYLRFCHNGTAWQFTVLPFGLSTSPRVFTKMLKPVLAFAHLHRVKLHMYIDDWLLNPGTHQEALEQTSWLRSLCRRLGLVLNLEKSGSNPFSGCHVSGDRAGHLCRPSKAVTQEVDQLAIRSGGIHSTAVTTCCPVAPSTWTPSLSRETSALWSNSHSSHSMAIETPVESVEN